MSANIRKITLELLCEAELADKYVNLLLNSPKLSALDRSELSALTALLYTTVENKYRYDYFIGAISGRALADIDLTTKNILRIGMCQILDMNSIPDFAAVNETVKLARNPGERSFVNAILRATVKKIDSLPYPDREKKPLRYLSVKHSMPMPLVKLYHRLFGEDTEKLLCAFSSQRPLSISVNEGKITRAELIEKLSQIGAEAAEYTDNGIHIKENIPPKLIKGFSEGEFFVQDEASRIAVAALGVCDKDIVVDTCAAPGGKSFLAAIKAPRGKVYSFDLHESKLSLIESGAERLGIENITVSARDALAPDPDLFGKADKVICDAPCSGLGVIAKKPDIRYKDLGSIEELPALQYSILSEAAKYLKVGGRMIYSTCTLVRDENEGVSDKFVSEHEEFEYEDFEVGDLRSVGGRLTLLPHIHGTDGFYVSLIRRIK